MTTPRGANPADRGAAPRRVTQRGILEFTFLSQSCILGIMDARSTNLIGALALALSDAMAGAVTEVAGHGGAAPATLASLYAEPGMTVEALSRMLGISGSGTVRLLDRLAADGLVERGAGRDGRTLALRLTRRGRAAAERVLTGRRAAVERALAVLPPGDLAELTRLTERVLAEVTTDRDTADQICRLCDIEACPGPRCPVEQAAP